LRGDLSLIGADEWVPHFNKACYEGDWSAAPLRSIGGAAGQIYPDPTARNFAGTPILDRCHYFQQVLDSFRCDLLSARLLRLEAGSKIREHSDLNLAYEDGEIRVHIPVQTSPQVEFYLDGRRIVMGEGECWYVNTSLRHRVHNRGPIDRIHLVVDCVVNGWMGRFFETDSDG
jgi:hypothetical protein